MKRQEERQFLKAPAKAAPYGKFVKLWASTLNVRMATGLAETGNLQTHSDQKLLPLSIQKNEALLTPLARGTIPALHLVIFHWSLVLSTSHFIVSKQILH